MYSPKIPEALIPRIYRAARRQRRPMTRLVAEAVELYLTREEVLAAAHIDDRSAAPPQLAA